MKLKFIFNPQALKNVKPTIQTIFRLLESNGEQLPRVYLIHFTKTKNLRLLIDSEKNPIIVSLGVQLLTNEKLCSFKDGYEIISVAFENTEMFFKNFINVLEKQDQYGLVMEVKKEVLENKERKFLKLTFKNNDQFICRIPVQMPRYDLANIKFHPFICGIGENEKSIDFVVTVDELLNMMRYMIKLKVGSGVKLCLNFNFAERSYTAFSSDAHCLPSVQGQIKITSMQTERSNFSFEISSTNLKFVFEIMRKYKDLKMIISSSFHLVFVFMKEDLFVSHIDMYEWIQYVGTGDEDNGDVRMKIQEVDMDGGW